MPYRLFPSTWNTRRVAFACLAMGIALIVIGVLGGVAFSVSKLNQVRTTQIDGTPQGKKILDAAERILSCTNTQGQCSRQNKQQQAEILAGLVESNKKAAADAAGCAAEPQVMAETDVDRRVAAILRCMNAR